MVGAVADKKKILNKNKAMTFLNIFNQVMLIGGKYNIFELLKMLKKN